MVKRSVIAVAVSVSLVACGGGGGSGGALIAQDTPGGVPSGFQTQSSPLIRPDVPFYAPVNINAFRPNVDNTYHVAEIGVFARDLNRDGKDEVMTSAVSFNGSATPQTWNHANLQIFGWNSGVFTNETSSWFQGISNQYVGGTTIRFGDFNNDGNLDAFAAAFTDNPNVSGSSVLLFNTGNNRFTRTDLDLGNVGAHDSLVHDFNGDGYADIWLTDITELRPVLVLGGANGQLTAHRSDQIFGGAAGISVADFLGDGGRTVIMTDAAGTDINGINHDTKLYSWRISNGKLELTELGVLPPDRFYLPKWDSLRSNTPVAPHAVRNISMDFDADGRPDVVVFSTMPKNGNVHGYSEIQFLRNTGGGVFVDVTDTVLTKFDHNKTTTYNPQIIDANNDGLMDILITATDYTGQPSTSVLLATKEGQFVESFVEVFSDLSQQVRSLTGPHAGSAGEIAIITGPNNTRYLFTTVETEVGGVSQIKTWLSQIGSTGTVTPQATVTALKQAWPWMSPAEVNASLETTVSQWIDGLPVLDPWAAFNPIGGLGISLDGRSGQRHAITGVLAMPGFDPRQLTNVTAIDALGRNFRVDLSGMSAAVNPAADIRFSDASVAEQTWSTRFVSNSLRMEQGFDAQGDLTRWTTGARFAVGAADSGRTVSVSLSHMPGSPWMALSGIWGRIDSTTMMDAQVTQRWSDGFWSQIGMIQTVTDLTPGMVRSVDPLWAGYAVSGWTDGSWSMYGGVQPTIFHGSVHLRLPGRVDNAGVLHYNDIEAKIRNPMIAFLGLEHRWQTKHTMSKISTQVNDLSQYQVKFTYGYKF